MKIFCTQVHLHLVVFFSFKNYNKKFSEKSEKLIYAPCGMKCEPANFVPKTNTCVLSKKNKTERSKIAALTVHSFFFSAKNSNIGDLKFAVSSIIQHYTYLFFLSKLRNVIYWPNFICIWGHLMMSPLGVPLKKN